MTWREVVGWGVVAAGSLYGIAAAAIKGGTFEALTAASAAFAGAAAMWGYTNKKA
jgi:outer membrane lipoprotein SlyB